MPHASREQTSFFHIFATGLLHLTLLFAYPSNTQRSQQWRTRFRQLQVTPRTYYYHHFLSPNSVYIKLRFNIQPPHRRYHQHGHFYIGSTAIGVPHRERNRRAKLKQLPKKTFPFQLNSPFATGSTATLSTSTPPFNFPHMTPMTKPGSMTTSPTGCLPPLPFHFPPPQAESLGLAIYQA